MTKKYPYKKKECQFCKREIDSQTKKCPHCHRYLYDRYSETLARNLKIQQASEEGLSYQAIANKYNLSKTRVEQIVGRNYQQ